MTRSKQKVPPVLLSFSLRGKSNVKKYLNQRVSVAWTVSSTLLYVRKKEHVCFILPKPEFYTRKAGGRLQYVQFMYICQMNAMRWYLSLIMPKAKRSMYWSHCYLTDKDVGRQIEGST